MYFFRVGTRGIVVEDEQVDGAPSIARGTAKRGKRRIKAKHFWHTLPFPPPPLFRIMYFTTNPFPHFFAQLSSVIEQSFAFLSMPKEGESMALELFFSYGCKKRKEGKT